MRILPKHSLALSCALLTFSLLPPAAVAQRQGRSAQTAETPVFADDLTRAALGTIRNLDDHVPAEARMTPGPNSHMVVMGAETSVWCPEGKFIELDPNLNIVGFTPISIAVFENKQQTQAFGLDKPYTVRIDAPARGVNRKEVYIIAYDAQAKARTVMHCIIRSHIANSTIAALDYKPSKEQCGFAIRDRQTFTTSCLYLGDIYLGQVGANADKVDVDQRLLPPGTYSCQVVGKNADDILVPGESNEFTVPKRYSIQCDGDPANLVIGEHADEKLKVTVAHTPGLSIKKTRVYIAGLLAKEKEGDDFTVDLPMHDVPTGNCFIEVVGIAEDGVTYPVESLPVTIKNEPWEQRLFHTLEYEQISANREKIDKLWQDVCSNLDRAKFEPNVYMDSKTFTLESITNHYTVGKSAEFQAAAKRAFIEMTQLQLQTARLYRKLKMRTSAASMYTRVYKELGADSLDGETAFKERQALRNEPATAL